MDTVVCLTLAKWECPAGSGAISREANAKEAAHQGGLGRELPDVSRCGIASNANGSFADARRSHSHHVLPKFLPCSMPRKDAGAFSNPSTMSSRYFEGTRAHPLADVVQELGLFRGEI
jgi:hypothetical protein